MRCFIRWALPSAAVALVLVLSACGSSDKGADRTTAGRAGTNSSPVTSSIAPPTPALVGMWQRVQRCSELERVMTRAGLRGALLKSIAGDGWIPGVTRVAQIKDLAHPCRGAVARRHSHFFTADGRFGSRDANGQQVDDGDYHLVGGDTVMINKVTFRYKITGGDTIAFTPVVPHCAPSCFRAGWSVAVAYPGYTWHRVT